MIVRPHTLSIITTHQCTAACDHCCFSCTPRSEKAIPVRHIHKYIEQATELGSFRVVVFTGGECFLLGKDLDDLVATCQRNGFFSRFVSNGYWAVSRAQARKRLSRLKDRGLTEANFSTGDMHARYVPPERVKHGALAAVEMGLTTVIMVEMFQGSSFPFDCFVDDPELQTAVEEGKLMLKLSPWMPFSGEEKLSYTDAYLEEVNRTQELGCSTVLRVLAINPDEHLIACCGLTFEEIEEVHLGDLRKRSIQEIVRGVPDDFVKIWIHLYGPDSVIRYAQQFDPSIERPSALAHICDSCRYLYHHPRIKEIIRSNPPPNQMEITQQYYQSLMVSANTATDTLSMRLHTSSCSMNKMRELRRIAVA